MQEARLASVRRVNSLRLSVKASRSQRWVAALITPYDLGLLSRALLLEGSWLLVHSYSQGSVTIKMGLFFLSTYATLWLGNDRDVREYVPNFTLLTLDYILVFSVITLEDLKDQKLIFSCLQDMEGIHQHANQDTVGTYMILSYF